MDTDTTLCNMMEYMMDAVTALQRRQKGGERDISPEKLLRQAENGETWAGNFFAAFGKGKASEEGIVLCLWAAAGAPTRE